MAMWSSPPRNARGASAKARDAHAMSSVACSSWCMNVWTSCARFAGARMASGPGVFSACGDSTSDAGRPGPASLRGGGDRSQRDGTGGGASLYARSTLVT